MSIRFCIAALVFLMVSAVLFGIGIVAVLVTPAFAVHAGRLIPAVIVASFVIAAPLSWRIAPKLMARYRRIRPPASSRPKRPPWRLLGAIPPG
jgi:hypothetical protein